MGTPEFAGDIRYNTKKPRSCRRTAADKPAGRGQKLKYSAVKEYALANNLPLLQPINLKMKILSELKSLNANLQVVVARMLPKVVGNAIIRTFNHLHSYPIIVELHLSIGQS
jgi:methionyl-tRNA formyltransferase